MIKKLLSLTLASISTLALAGCGSDTLPPLDQELMGDGTSNKSGLGGYWWTYVDRSGKSEVSPDTGKEDPKDTTTKPPKLKDTIGPGVGIDEGAFHVKGKVGGAPNYQSEEESDMDRYVDAFYGKGKEAEHCIEDSCGEMAYPTAGIGFSFREKNAVLGDKANDKIGLGFRMKIGDGHAMAGDEPQPIYVELPTDLTDVPDPTFDDRFGTAFVNPPVTPNKPFCTFPGSLEENLDTQRAEKTCYRNATTQDHATLKVGKDWKTFCLKWDKFGLPPYPPPAMEEDSWKSIEEDRARLIKVQFAAFKPEEGSDPVGFDFYVDDVYLLTDANWAAKCKDFNEDDLEVSD